MDGPPESKEERVADKQEYRYFQPIRLRKLCIECHQHLSGNFVLGAAGLPAPRRPWRVI